jgi:hypothetical protein
MEDWMKLTTWSAVIFSCARISGATSKKRAGSAHNWSFLPIGLIS